MTQVVVLKIHKDGQLVEEKRFTHVPVVFGSSETESHVVLKQEGISPIHARIEKRAQQFFICDMGSETGTFKNSDKILEARLQSGDSIHIGEFLVEFDLEELAASAQQTSPPPSESSQPKPQSSQESPEPPADETTQAPPAQPEPQSQKSPKTPVDETTPKTPPSSTVEPSQPMPQTFTQESSKTSPSRKKVSKNGFRGVSPKAEKPTVQTSVTPSVGISSEKVSNPSTFAPKGPYQDINEFIKPTKGNIVEVLVAWRERVISVYHFSRKGSLVVGTDPSCDVIVPLISSNSNKASMLQIINNQVQIVLYPGMEGVLIREKQSIDFSQMMTMGRGGNHLALKQSEMARIQLGGEVELVVRYASQAPKPAVIPFMDLSSNGFLVTLLAVVLSGILMLWVTLNRLDQIDRPEDEEFRTALIITKPPPRPPTPPKVTPPPPSKPKPREIKKVIKMEKKKKVTKRPKKSTKLKTSKRKKKKRVRVTKTERSRKRRGGGGGGARSVRGRNKTRTNRVGSVKKGGSVKTARKQGAQMQSEKNLKKSGIFSAFGSGGRNNRLDQSYSGSGELAGLADQASGSAGFAEDRPGEGLGSRFRETGAGRGRSNVGVTNLRKKGRSRGSGGFSGVGLGNRKSVSIIPGGQGEEFSGQIDRDGIRRVFYDNQRAIRYCYEKELNRNPMLSGTLKLNFDIGEHGRVVGRPSIKWGSSTMKSRTVASCVLNRLRSWRFPEPPRNQVVNVMYPLAFSAR